MWVFRLHHWYRTQNKKIKSTLPYQKRFIVNRSVLQTVEFLHRIF